ncbi:hypothetical protein SRHO_G00337640 [Serrasalmus rhombeus]
MPAVVNIEAAAACACVYLLPELLGEKWLTNSDYFSSPAPGNATSSPSHTVITSVSSHFLQECDLSELITGVRVSLSRLNCARRRTLSFGETSLLLTGKHQKAPHGLRNTPECSGTLKVCLIKEPLM